MNRADDIVEKIMWGESFHGIDITTVLDGEVVDGLLLLLVRRKFDEATDWLKDRVQAYVERDERLLDLHYMDEQEELRDSAVDWEIKREKEMA